MSQRKALLILGSIVLILLAVCGAAIMQIGSEAGTPAWIGASLGALSGAAACAAIFLYSIRRNQQDSGSQRWQWLLFAVVGSGPAWSLLAPEWEATLVGFMSGFLVCWMLGLIAASQGHLQARNQ